MKADELTVNNGTSQNDYVPFYGYYGDAYTKCEFIIPATDLAAMNGKTITALKFFSNTASVNWTGSFQVFLKEVEATTLAAFTGTTGATVVFEGTGLAIDANKEMSVTFTEGYTYNGGNLLVGFYQIGKGNYKSVKFYGVNQDNYTAWQGYNSSGLDAITGSGKYFLPKTMFTYEENVSGPGFAAYDGTTKLNSPYSYNFGLATAGATKTFTLKNPGTESVNVSVSETGSFGATLSASSIAAGGEATLTVTMPEATGNSTITITPTGLDPFVINASGTIRDPNKVYEYGFTALPEDWTTSGSWSYSEANGAYTTVWYLSSNARLITPLLTVSEGEQFFVEAKGYSTSNTSYQHLQMQYSADGTTWTNFDSEPTLDPSSWNTFSFTGVPAGQYYIAINASQADIRMFYGGELPQIAKMVVTAEDHNFGLIDADATTTFVISNTGKAELTGIQVLSDNAAFTIENAPTTLAVGAEATVTVKMSAANTGEFNGVITIKADDQTDVTFNVSGVVLPEGLSVIDFEDNQLPSGWEQVTSNKWSFADGKAYATSAAEMVTSKLQFAEGDLVAIMATSYDNYDNNYLEVYASSDEGATWTLLKKFVSRSQIPYGSYAPLILSDIPTTTNMLKFKGYYVRIEEIRGLTFDQNAPLLSISPVEDAAFGTVTAAVSKTYTVANAGTGTLTVNISSDNEAFVVEPAQLEVTDEAQTFTVSFTPTEGNYGKFNANITVTPTYDETAAVSFAASATVKNPNVWDEDFEEGTLPAGWDANNWTIGKFTSYENSTYMALAPSSSTAGTLITPPLEAKAGDVLTWDAYLNWYDEALIVEYSSDEKATWTQIYNYKTQEDAEAPSTTHRYYNKPMSFTAPADGIYYLRFTSTYQNGVDNFNGFKLALKEHDALITSQNIPATGNQYVEYTASVTVKELVGKDENVIVEFYLGDDQVAETSGTLDPNSSETFTVTFTPNEAYSGEASFVVTFVSDDDEVFATFESDAVEVNIAAAPVLDETVGMPEGMTNWGNYPAIEMDYSLKAGWNTIVLPFAWSDLSVFGEGAKAYSFNDYSNGAIDFKVVTELNAQTPYIIYAPAAMSKIVFADVKNFRTSTELSDLRITHNDAVFQGTYEPIAAPDMQGKYGVVPSTGKIQKGGANASLKGFRAYFELPGNVNGAKLNFLDENGNVETSIDAVELMNTLNGDFYDLSGRKIEGKTKAGVYIKNGKKVVVK